MNQQLTDITDNTTSDQVTVTAEQLGEYLGLTIQRIGQLEKEQIVEKLARGQFLLQKSVRSYCEYLRGVSRGSDTAKNEQKERTRLTSVKADLAELEHAEKQGELIQADIVRRQDFALATILKNNLQSMPDRVSAIVAAETDPAVVHDAIAAEVKNSLEDIITAMEQTEVDDATLDITRHLAVEELEKDRIGD